MDMGGKARGQPGQPFSHKNGHSYVKAHRGFYHDAIFVKRNNFNLLLHETFGGGFSSLVWPVSFAVSAAGYGGIWRDVAGYGGIWRDTGRYTRI